MPYISEFVVLESLELALILTLLGLVPSDRCLVVLHFPESNGGKKGLKRLYGSDASKRMQKS